NVNKAAAAFNAEKLLWVNQQHMMRTPSARLADLLAAQLARLGIECTDRALLEGVAALQRERARTLKEMAESSRYFFVQEIELDEKAVRKHLDTAGIAALEQVHARLLPLADFSAERVHDVLVGLASELDVGLGKVAQPLRVALCGGAVSPPIDSTAALIGRLRVLERIDRAISRSQGAARGA
ncbi:MAG: glutamate--tRNA ligase, partial [Steroidobacteraceae bacterium]